MLIKTKMLKTVENIGILQIDVNDIFQTQRAGERTHVSTAELALLFA